MARQNPPESELTIYDTDQFGADIYKQSNKVKLCQTDPLESVDLQCAQLIPSIRHETPLFLMVPCSKYVMVS